MNLIYDTGSDWLVVESAKCSNCQSNYDPEASDFFVDIGGRNESKVYGSFMRVEGRTVQDQVCLKKREVCIDPFNFFLVTDQSGIP